VRDDDLVDLTYTQLLDLGAEFVSHAREKPPATFDAVRFWAEQPSFVAACQMAFHLGQGDHEGRMREDSLEEDPDPDELRSEGYGAALREVRDWATEAKDEAALSWVAGKTKDVEGKDGAEG
jgi:hypothetical protein